MLQAATAALVGTGEKVPWSCQTPFRKFEESMNGSEQFAAFFHREAMDLKNSPKWKPMDISGEVETVGDIGDMKMETQDQVGTYHFVKATFTIPNTTLPVVLGYLTSDKKSVRAQYATDVCELEFFAEKGNQQLFRIAYVAPSVGGAGRDLIFLTGRQANSNTNYETWGCSVDIASRPEDYEGYVRGAALYHWDLVQKGPDAVVSYCACFDPRGWAPPFLIEWYKSSATKEFALLRKVCAGRGGSASSSTSTAPQQQQSKAAATAQQQQQPQNEPGSPSDFL